jgi:hypothetical protein
MSDKMLAVMKKERAKGADLVGIDRIVMCRRA